MFATTAYTDPYRYLKVGKRVARPFASPEIMRQTFAKRKGDPVRLPKT